MGRRAHRRCSPFWYGRQRRFREGCLLASGGHGLDSRSGAKPLGLSPRGDVHRHARTEGEALESGPRRFRAGRPERGEGGVPVHRPGQPVAGNGPGPVRMRAGGPRGSGSLRRDAARDPRSFPAGRDVLPSRGTGLAGRHCLDTAGPFRARVRPVRAVGQRRDPSRGSARAQCRRAGCRPRGRRVRNGRRTAVRGDARGTDGRAADNRSRSRSDGSGVRTGGAGPRGHRRPRIAMGRPRPERGGRQRDPIK